MYGMLFDLHYLKDADGQYCDGDLKKEGRMDLPDL